MPLTPLNFCVKVNKQNTFNYQLTNEAMGRGCLADYPLQGGNQDAKGGLIINYQLSTINYSMSFNVIQCHSMPSKKL